MPKSEKSVAIIVTCHNYSHFLVDCLDSLRKQNVFYKDLIVVDDSSRDPEEVISICQRFGARYRRIDSKNVLQARKTGLDETFSEFVLFMDADNKLPPKFLSTGLKCFTDPTVGVAYTDLEMFGDETGTFNLPKFSKDQLQRVNCVDNCALVRRRAISSLSEYWLQNSLTFHEDWQLWKEVVKKWKFVKFDSFVHYRVHAHNKSKIAKKIPYYKKAGMDRKIDLFIPLSGKAKIWKDLYTFLHKQSFDKSRINLILFDTSGKESFSRSVRRWLSSSLYTNFRFITFPCLERDLANKDRTNKDVEFKVAQYMCSIYNLLYEITSTELVWVLEDDVIPPLDNLELMLNCFNPNVGCVIGPYPSRWSNEYVAWRGQGSARRHIEKGQGLQKIDGSGFGNIILRRSLLEDYVFHVAQDIMYFDVNFFRDLPKRWNRICNWACESKHIGNSHPNSLAYRMNNGTNR